ncbi:TetR/AcrR family transcriptional regulator [Clostridium sp. WILCCON 0269]|uniref:TetR/AcrR family transcriptional regulator n=1 Tax=Candidatus Clostridium eludens TaxID=3381663 RepID=A0ABW8SQ47_9CLOT
MKRVPDPEIRKKQILETAMQLFYEKGYENTSMEDIARELQVVKGLCYRYFDSKQALFKVVIDEYAIECCQDFLKIIHNPDMTIKERLKTILMLMLQPKEKGRYHDFFHKLGNEVIHEQITVKMCKYMIPHVEEELENLFNEGKLATEYPKIMAQFLMYGQIGIWQESEESIEIKVHQFGEIIKALLDG